MSAAFYYSSKSRLIIFNISLMRRTTTDCSVPHGQRGSVIWSGSESEGERTNKNYFPLIIRKKHIFNIDKEHDYKRLSISLKYAIYRSDNNLSQREYMSSL